VLEIFALSFGVRPVRMMFSLLLSAYQRLRGPQELSGCISVLQIPTAAIFKTTDPGRD
jgi:hypothetical protein